MKKRISFVVILSLFLMILVGVPSVAAQPAGDAKSRIQMTEIKVVDGEQVFAHNICVEFYEFESDTVTSSLSQVDQVCGAEWLDGEVGQYWIVYVNSGSTPEREGDPDGYPRDR